jgi:hypothetical protein
MEGLSLLDPVGSCYVTYVADSAMKHPVSFHFLDAMVVQNLQHQNNLVSSTGPMRKYAVFSFKTESQATCLSHQTGWTWTAYIHDFLT